MTTMRFNPDDRAALERIIASDPTILNLTDAVRRAIHEKDARRASNTVAA